MLLIGIIFVISILNEKKIFQAGKKIESVETFSIFGQIMGRSIDINNREDFRLILDNLGVFKPHNITLLDDKYSSGYSISHLEIEFTDKPQNHVLFASSKSNEARSSVSTRIQNEKLHIKIFINPDQENVEKGLSLARLSLFQTLFLLTNDSKIPGNIEKASVYSLNMNTQQTEMQAHNRILIEK